MSRKSARSHAFKLIYQLNFLTYEPNEILHNYILPLQNLDEYEKNIIHDEFLGVYQNLVDIDEIIITNSKWPISRLNKIDLSLIRLAIYEIFYEKNKTPIVINEIVNLANAYGADSSTSFVNGILAKISVGVEMNE